ncbi:diguanylate cyclase [Niveibacterium sp. SC-1]|uniref:diguanylate cyclase domain-containing protein n=1 Tax=Niveibacterium sp. SC-1 TaxID=3135646 RepID=UPI00311DD8A4
MFGSHTRFTRALLLAGGFAAVWGGGLAVLAVTLLTEPRAWPIGVAVVVTALVAALGALILLSLARSWTTDILGDLLAAVRASDATGGAVSPSPTGWKPFDTVVREVDRLARLRTLRIDALTRQEARFRALSDSTHSVELWFGRNGALMWVSRSIERVTGFSRAECLLAPSLIDLLVLPKDRPQMSALARGALRGESRNDFELRIQRKDGETRWIACHWLAMRDARGRLLGVRLSAEDIQPRKDAEIRLLDTVASLRRAQALKEHYLQRTEDERLRLAALLNTLRHGILFVDRDRRVYYANLALRHMWALGEDENLTGQRDEVLIERTRGLRKDDETYLAHIGDVLAKRASSGPYEIECSDGRVLEEVSALVGSEDGSRYIGRVWIYEDVTERRRTAQRLIELAERDTLTNLLNRRRFHEELNRMIAEAGRQQEKVGLLAFDLDGFKTVNDEHGHAAGDQVLIDIARSVGTIVRRNELFFRLGGDEFALLIPDADPVQVRTLAHRINAQVSEVPFTFPTGVAHVGASIGIALYPDHAQEADALMECADRAMYRAKAAGKNTAVVFEHG